MQREGETDAALCHICMRRTQLASVWHTLIAAMATMRRQTERGGERGRNIQRQSMVSMGSVQLSRLLSISHSAHSVCSSDCLYQFCPPPPCVFSSPSPLCYTLPLCLSATCACAAPPKLKLANNSSRLNLSCFEFQFTFLFRFQFHSISNLCCLPPPLTTHHFNPERETYCHYYDISLGD